VNSRSDAGGPARGRPDGVARARRAGAADRDEHLYGRRRAEGARKRAAEERRTFDPAPPGDDDWVVGEEETDGLRRIGPPTPVGETIEGLVRRRGWEERLRGAALWTNWEAIVGPELCARCEPVRLAGGTLVIRAESQPWATQLRYLAGRLRTNAAAVLGERAVRDVQVVVGPLDSGAAVIRHDGTGHGDDGALSQGGD